MGLRPPSPVPTQRPRSELRAQPQPNPPAPVEQPPVQRAHPAPKPSAPKPPARRPAPRREQANGFTVAAILAGVLGIVLSEFAPLYLFWVPLALGVVATGCGIVGSRRNTWRRSWIGTVLGVVALLLGLAAAYKYNAAIEDLRDAVDNLGAAWSVR